MSDAAPLREDEMSSAPSVAILIQRLPAVPIQRILSHLPVVGRLALTSTCRALSAHRPAAFTSLTLSFPSHSRLLAAAHELLDVLQHNPAYTAAVQKLAVHGQERMDNTADAAFYAAHMAELDARLLALLTHLPGIEGIALDFQCTGCYFLLPHTLWHVLTLPRLGELALRTLHLPHYDALAPDVRQYAPHALRRMSLDCVCGNWLNCVLGNPTQLRWLSLRVSKPDDVCGRVVHSLAQAAVHLETLSVCAWPMHLTKNVEGYSGLFAHGFASGVLSNLRSFSLSAFLAPPTLEALFRAFAASRVTRIRLVVNFGGRWLEDFSPRHIVMLAQCVPHLEELVLDQDDMTEAAPLPGSLADWAAAIRHIPNLRVLALASMFVLDVYGPYQDVESGGETSDEDGYADGGGDDDDDDDDDVDSEGAGSEGTSVGSSDRARRNFWQNIVAIAAWADTLLDEHLRIVRPFEELWFLGVRVPAGYPPEDSVSGGGVGFRQHVDEEQDEDGARRRRFIIRPAARSGWWWESWA
ncbi:hypothetical protein DENSPDRAFT_315574 [Dentipellis sp. KUC8613]|nr:hypothetical protein DENSPDRAFT_315574 [Dentipellis sp. KUC8613]